jgi:hypothetical protein
MSKAPWACSLCGSRDWPNTYTRCPACYGEPDEPEPEDYEPEDYEPEPEQ